MDECRECRIELRAIVLAVSDRSARLYVASRRCKECSKIEANFAMAGPSNSSGVPVRSVTSDSSLPVKSDRGTVVGICPRDVGGGGSRRCRHLA